MYELVSCCQCRRGRYIYSMTQISSEPWVQTAPADASVREQLVAAAGEHFKKFGYEKTTLVELANSIGFSKTYFYRFFASKREIGEAICSQCLDRIIVAIDAEVATAKTATDKLRRMLRTIPNMGSDLFFEERKLYDVAAVSAAEEWSSSAQYRDRLAEILHGILLQGRESGEFERKTPIDEVMGAILLAMVPFIDPRVLQFHLDFVPNGSNEVIAMILRSLAP
ncbi:MAG TPA: TetR/AcrR family transcriptional regulator [Novosphingobium sp.]|nr:TetR/AcrR family transcriptional regulator [Novosphingobium sp.]